LTLHGPAVHVRSALAQEVQVAMNRRIAARLAFSLGLIAALASGCSREKEEAQAPSDARPLSVIWPEVLAQRDILQDMFAKPLEEVTHEDCAAVGAAARRIDALSGEILSWVPASASGKDEGRLRSIGDVVIQMQGVTSKIRESALAETPGQWIYLRFPLDQTLRSAETYFTPEELGGQSVAARPNFESKPQPAALSPI
jgi:hypothetical protein